MMSLRAKLVQLPVQRIARFTAVVAIAMAVGHLVQTLAAARPPVQLADAAVTPTHIVQLSSGGLVDQVVLRRDGPPPIVAVATPTPEAVTCKVDLALSQRPSAMIGVTLMAPCHAGQRIVLRQAALAVTARVGADGKVSAVLPALTTEGAVAVLFGDGTRADASIAMPQAAALRRFGVQWQGADAFGLHGLENGADFDQPGDISPRNPGQAGLDAGFMTVLGDRGVENPLLAEVYTYPLNLTQQPEIVLEAAVLAETCGRDLLGEVLSSQSGQVTVTDLTLAMPDCSGIGDFLVLNNLASDLKIAAN